MTINEMKFLRPFGPSIAKVRLPDEIINSLNDYVDKIISDDDKLLRLDHSNHLAGKVKQEFLLENEFMQKIKWGEFLGRAIKMWLQDDIDKELKSIDIIRCWIVRQFQNEYNPVHHHSGHVSGVGYLKVPESFGKVSEKKKN